MYRRPDAIHFHLGFSDAIRTPPIGLSTEDEIDGVYHSAAARLIDNFRAQLKRGLPFTLTLQNILSILDALIASKFEGGVDDRLYLVSAYSFPLFVQDGAD